MRTSEVAERRRRSNDQLCDAIVGVLRELDGDPKYGREIGPLRDAYHEVLSANQSGDALPLSLIKQVRDLARDLLRDGSYQDEIAELETASTFALDTLLSDLEDKRRQVRDQATQRLNQASRLERFTTFAEKVGLGIFLASIVSATTTLVAIPLDHALTPLSSNTVSECTSAQTQVKTAVLKNGIDRPELLDRINSASVDKKCGDERTIACDVLDGLSGQTRSEYEGAWRRLRCSG